MKTKKRWLKYRDMFLRGWSIAQIAAIYEVYGETVEQAIRSFVKPGGR